MRMNIIDHDLLSIQEARILAENALEAQRTLATFPQEKLDEIVERMAEEISKHSKELAVMSSEETDYGNWQDKYIKNRFACEYLPANLKGMRCVGIIHTDQEKQIMDVGVPMGVIVGLCPATSPVSTTIYNALIAIKAGNAVIFSPHPRAKQSIAKTLDIMIQAAEGYGLPEGALTYLHTVTQAGTIELMNHSATSLIMNTGVPAMLEAAYHSGKPVIYGGTGNGPAFIERTANIRQAVQDIIASKTFDNGVASAAEQSIVVDSCIANEAVSYTHLWDTTMNFLRITILDRGFASGFQKMFTGKSAMPCRRLMTACRKLIAVLREFSRRRRTSVSEYFRWNDFIRNIQVLPMLLRIIWNGFVYQRAFLLLQ